MLDLIRLIVILVKKIAVHPNAGNRQSRPPDRLFAHENQALYGKRAIRGPFPWNLSSELIFGFLQRFPQRLVGI